jgi:hypothetical protein
MFSPCRAGVIRVPPAKCGTNTTSKQASAKLISHRIFAGSGNLWLPEYNFFDTSAVVRRSKSLELGHIRLMA